MSYKITQLPSVPAGTVTEQISLPVSKTSTDPKTYKMTLQQVVTFLQGQGIGAGTQGTTGTQGGTGSGTQGGVGSQGGTGGTGTQGGAGTQGSVGGLGSQGATGAQGLDGPQGPTGIPGSSGYSGFDGNSGFSGFIGSQGFAGVQGASGYSGSPGSNTGMPGPGLVYTGYYRGTQYTYYSSLNRKDIASYSGVSGLTYYLANSNTLSGDYGNSGWPTPGTTSDWSTFGNTFESVATDLLLANDVSVTKTITLGQVGVASQGIIRSANADWVGTPNASGFWLGSDIDGNARFFVGNYSPGGSYLIYDSATGILSLSGTIFADAGSIGGVGITQGQLYTGVASAAGTIDTPFYLNGSKDPGGNTSRTYMTLGDTFKYYRVSGASTPTNYMWMSGGITATYGSIGGVGIAEEHIYTGQPGLAGTTSTPFYLNGTAAAVDASNNSAAIFYLGDSFKWYKKSGASTPSYNLLLGKTGMTSDYQLSATGNYLFWNGATGNLELSGALYADAGKIAGWKMSGSTLWSANNTIALEGGVASPLLPPYIGIGISGYSGNSGIWLGLHGGAYKMSVRGGFGGDGMVWDGNSLDITGSINITGGQAATDINNATQTANNAQTTANNAQTTANNAQSVALGVSGTVVTLDTKVFTDASGRVVKPPTTGTAGLFLGSGNMGYHDGTNWKTYMANNGNFFLTGTGNNFLEWTSNTLSIQGTVKASQGTIGGWEIYSDKLQSTANNVFLNSSSSPHVSVGTTAFGGNGVFLGVSGGENVFSAGDGSVNYLKWDGNKLNIGGGLYVDDTIGMRKDTNAEVLTITGGSDNGYSNGAQIDLCGITGAAGGNAGCAVISGGNGSGGQVFIRTGDEFRITVLKGGNVGIGETNPDKKLDVTGTGHFSDDLTVGASITLDASSGQIDATSFNTPSSLKFKTNITPITNAMDVVTKLQGVTFDWSKEGISRKNDFGFIAEEVDKLLPTIVGKDSSGNATGIDYGRITALLVETVKELNARVKTLEAQLNK